MTSPNGLLLVDKPRGLTSHDVVARVRRLLGERRVGHAGTLDPMATGLLVIAVGPSTRLLRFAQAETKRYSGVVRLGTATDSLDADGTVIASAEVPELTEADVNAAAQHFVGVIEQVPPMVSAIKIGGRRLHEIAREGGEVERPAREVTISRFDLHATDDPREWAFDVVCSTGTYVRVLAADLALALGTVGHLVALRRESSGEHEAAGALNLDQLAARVEAGANVLLPPREFLTSLPSVVLDADQTIALGHGKQLDLEPIVGGDEVAAFDETGALLGVLRRRGERWQPDVVFAAL